jgi:hypothetical protein
VDILRRSHMGRIHMGSTHIGRNEAYELKAVWLA